MPRSKPSRTTYIATATPMTAAQISGRYHSMTVSLLESRAAFVLRGGNWTARRERAGLFGDLGRTAVDQAVDVIDAEGEHDAIGQHEQSQGAGDRGGGHRRSGL